VVSLGNPLTTLQEGCYEQIVTLATTPIHWSKKHLRDPSRYFVEN